MDCGGGYVKDVACQEKSWTKEELLQRIVQSADRIEEVMKLSER
jgi:hypothetical protein